MLLKQFEQVMLHCEFESIKFTSVAHVNMC